MGEQSNSSANLTENLKKLDDEQEKWANMPKKGYFYGRPGPGRPPGMKNYFTADLKRDILESYQEGGKEWLNELKRKKPELYVSLLRAILPKRVEEDVQMTARLESHVIVEGAGVQNDTVAGENCPECQGGCDKNGTFGQEKCQKCQGVYDKSDQNQSQNGEKCQGGSDISEQEQTDAAG